MKNQTIGGTTLECIIWSLVELHYSVTLIWLNMWSVAVKCGSTNDQIIHSNVVPLIIISKQRITFIKYFYDSDFSWKLWTTSIAFIALFGVSGDLFGLFDWLMLIGSDDFTSDVSLPVILPVGLSTVLSPLPDDSFVLDESSLSFFKSKSSNFGDNNWSGSSA